MPELQSGTRLAGLEILGVLARGESGVVHLAREEATGRRVALTVLDATSLDERSRRRILARVEAVAATAHPNIAEIVAPGEEDGLLHVGTRFPEGTFISAVLSRDGAIAPERAAQITRQVAAALDAAHAAGVVHGDLTADAVLVDDSGHAVLTGFGPRIGATRGEDAPLAPEQARGERIDARTDVHALGALLERMLGDHPPAPLAAVVDRALAEAPDDRFPSAGDLGRAALAASRGGTALTAAAGRLVATGDAAPAVDTGDDDATDGTAGTPADSGPEGEEADAAPPSRRTSSEETTRDDEPPTSPEDDDARTGPPRPLVVLGVLAPIAVLGVAVALLLGGGGDDEPLPDRPVTVADTAPAGDEDPTGAFPAGSRPNDVAAAGGRVFVVSHPDDEMAILDARSGRTIARPDVGSGALSVDAGLGSAWVTKETGSLLRLDPRTGERLGAAVSLPPGSPVRVRTGAGAVWVGLRGAAEGAPAAVARIDPETLAVETIPVTGGLQDLDVGEDAVWVVSRDEAAVTRIDAESRETARIPVGPAPRGIAVGGGAAWVATSGDDSVVRIDLEEPYETTSVAVGDGPRGVAVADGSVWVTNELDATLTRLDAASGEVAEDAIGDVGRAPVAIAVGDGAVWVASAPDGAVTRIPVD